MASNYKESTSFSPFCPKGTILPYLGSTLPPGWAWLYPNIANRTLRCSNSYGTTSGINVQTITGSGIYHTHNTVTSSGMVQSGIHTHTINNNIAPSNTAGLTRTYDGGSSTGHSSTALTTDATSSFENHTATVQNTGSGQSFGVLNQYFTVHWIIKL